jgi:hypothetical protein
MSYVLSSNDQAGKWITDGSRLLEEVADCY